MPTDDAGTSEPIHSNLPEDITMNAKTLIATALLVSFAGVGSAFAQEATPDTWLQAAQSTKTRAEVSAELAAARASQRVDIPSIKSAFDSISVKTDVIVVEGAGGWLACRGSRRDLSRWRFSW